MPEPETFPFPGVQEDHFLCPSDVHGVGHVNRVLCLGRLVAQECEAQIGLTGFTHKYGAPLWAATFLHDLARRHDGVCFRHGRDAVKERLPGLRAFFAGHGVHENDFPAIATAVSWHCLNEELPRDHPHRTLTALLRDADALDRGRINEQPNPDMLRLPVSAGLIPVGNALVYRTLVHPEMCLDIQALWRETLALHADRCQRRQAVEEPIELGMP